MDDPTHLPSSQNKEDRPEEGLILYSFLSLEKVEFCMLSK
jgi:hypothetical protein